MGLNDTEILWSWLKGIFEAIELRKVAGLQLQEFHDKILFGSHAELFPYVFKMALIQGQLVSCRVANLFAAISAKPNSA